MTKMKWYDSLATYAIGGPVSLGSAYGTFRGLECLINKIPQDVMMPKGPLLDRVVAGGTEVIGALAVGTALIYATTKAYEGEWFYRVRSKLNQLIYGKEEAAEKTLETFAQQGARTTSPFEGRGRGVGDSG